MAGQMGTTGVMALANFPTAALTAHQVSSGSKSTTSQILKAGRDTDLFYGLVIATMPEAYDVYGSTKDARYDSGMKITNVRFAFTTAGSAGTDTYADNVRGYSVKALPRVPPAAASANPTPTWDYIEYVNSVGSSWTGGFDGTATNSDIQDAIEDTVYANLQPLNDGTAYFFDTHAFIKAKSINWGDSFCLAIVPNDERGSPSQEFFLGAGTGHTTHAYMNMTIEYEDPEPSKPVIKLSGGDDYLDAVITYTTKPSESDVIRWDHVWKSGAADTPNNMYTVNYTTTAANNAPIYDFGKEKYKQSEGDIDTGFLADEGTAYHLVSYAIDQTGNQNQTGVPSNIVSHTRMSCTGSLSAGTAIGQELTLTISGFSDAGNSSAAEFVKFGVNWDGEATATNDSINDYTIVTLDAAATTATVKHTYHTNGTYKVNVCVIDDKGFRSDFTQAASRSIISSNPVALLKASRDTAVRARYGDEFSVITLSAAHSYAVGSDRMIFAHKFQHNSNTPVTTYPMDNDNSNFNDVTTTVKLKCNRDNCASTVLKVFGKVSVSSDGTPNVDNDGSFDRYEYQVHEVSPSDTKETYGTVAQTGGENVLFKSVDFVVVSTLDGTDVVATTNGAVYTLADGDGNVINNKIRAAKDADMWGGYHAIGAVQVDFTNSNSTIHYDSGMSPASFLEQGLVPGDTIYVDSAVEDAANNDFFTIASVTATDIVVNETLTDESNDAGVYIYKINGPTLPIASYAENNPLITCGVRQALATNTTSQNLATSSNVTQTLRFESEEFDTLDLDTLADAGSISILSADMQRSGGLATSMPLGGNHYPIGTTRTKMGAPALSVSVRALTQAGYRALWNLIEGGRYEWATIDSKKVDSPGTAYKQLRLRLNDGSITKDPSMASQYTASLNFVVIGELVT